MCERTYTACPGCDNEVSECMTYDVRVSFNREYPVDRDGDPDYGYPNDGEDEEDGGQLYCRNCGSNYDPGDLIHDAEPEDCDCEECEPPPPTDPDELVTLVRRHAAESVRMQGHDRFLNFQNSVLGPCPPEVELLLKRRSIIAVPIRYERALEIEEWLESLGSYTAPVTVKMEPPPAHVLAAAIPEPTNEPEIDRNQLVLVGESEE